MYTWSAFRAVSGGVSSQRAAIRRSEETMQLASKRRMARRARASARRGRALPVDDDLERAEDTELICLADDASTCLWVESGQGFSARLLPAVSRSFASSV